ncbi:plasmid partition family protein (plasmid) [Borreliella valaisiana]|nr:plasmid partition family protein [Borreliella valaisiana]WLN25892.1 plasmid partition family protein [Borreliella valaisiana]
MCYLFYIFLFILARFIIIFNFKIARTQAYKYIKIAKFLFEGKLKEVNIIENGIDKTLFNLIKYKKVKSRTNLIKPLRVRL